VKLLVALFILVVSIGCSAADTKKDMIPNIDMVNGALSELDNTAGPGVQYVVVNKDFVIFERNVGLSDIGNNIPLSSNHTMAGFSMTKTLTAIALLQLVEHGKIKLDDRVSDYVEHPYHYDISVRHLLSHTSGIPNPIPLKWVHHLDTHIEFDEDAALAQILDENPGSYKQPGKEYEYTNIGYWLLGKLIETVTGLKYSDYVARNIFQVLALTPAEIGFVIQSEKGHAKGYLKKWSFMNLFGRFVIDKSILGDYEGGWLHINNVYLNGPSYGGAIGSATAFSKILQDLLSEHSQLLGKESKQQLYSQQYIVSGERIDMTLGWHMDKLNGAGYYYKEGGGPGFHSEMRIYPESGLASVLMTNRTSFNSRKILSELDANFVRD